MTSPAQDSERTLAAARASLTRQRAGGRGVQPIGRRSAEIRRRHALRKAVRITVAVAAVLVPEVDVVGLEALQAAVERAAHILGPAVDACDAALRRDLEAELGGDQRAVAAVARTVRIRWRGRPWAASATPGALRSITPTVLPS